ncbi:MAG: hypothetical protein FWD14_00955 [Treponema sp.]|nr:hypothetical protein [Treponema sp.]
MNLKAFILIILIVSLCFPVYSQEEQEEITENDLSENIYVISSFVFNISGLTRPYALINKADFISGEEIKGFENLEKYISNKTQLLYNERVLDSVSIDYTIGETREDGKYPVDLVIHVKDTWNIVAIPRPQYSSNSGFDITIKARDYNFLGTMSALRLDIGYRHDEHGRNSFNFMLDSDIPIRLFGINWNINFDHDVFYRPDMGKEWYYRNITGLSVELPFKTTTFTIGFDEHFIVNEELSDADKIQYGKDFQEGLYMSSRPFIRWKIPTSLEVGPFGELTYTPRLYATFNHEFPTWPLVENKKGPFLGFSHTLEFGRIDWLGNFKRGLAVGAYNSFSYNFYSLRKNEEPLSSDIGIYARGHLTFFDIFGFSARLSYRHWFNGSNDSAADVMRGILNKEVSADYMISLNLDLPVRALRIRPSQWFNNRKVRILDFDLHLSPIIDMAFYQDPQKPASFGKENLLLSAGMEMIIFPDFFRSLFLRISIAWNFSDISKRTPMELFIGTELHY